MAEIVAVPTHSNHLRRAKILVVDDDPVSLEALSGTLHLHLGHFTLDMCTSPVDALDRLRKMSFDTLISDIKLPAMDGLQLLQQTKEVRPTVPVVLMSGHMDRPLVAQALAAGAADFISKPIERRTLVFTLRQTLNISRLIELKARRERTVTRCLTHYIRMVDRLRRRLEARRPLSNVIDTADRYPPSAVLLDSLSRQRLLDEQLIAFTDRATRRMTELDLFIQNVQQQHREATDELFTAEARLRRTALLKANAMR